jgi:hypothetical protein
MQAQLTRYATGLGSGAAAALLFLAALRGAPLAVMLAYLGPLPIMIATLGWGYDIGLVALFCACGLAAAASPAYALVYGLVVAAPAWALAAFAAAPAFYLRKPADSPRRHPGPGAVAMLAAGIFAVAGAIQLSLMWFGQGGYDGAVAALADQIREALDASGAARALPPDMSVDDLARAVVQFAPVTLAGGATVMQLANLYLAARSVQLSQRLARPWRDIPTGFRLPRWLAAPALAGLALAVAAPSPYADYGLVVAAAAGVLYAAEGLAALHALSRHASARPFMLAALYFAVAIAAEWVLPALAILGIAESFVDLRGRAARVPKPRT